MQFAQWFAQERMNRRIQLQNFGSLIKLCLSDGEWVEVFLSTRRKRISKRAEIRHVRILLQKNINYLPAQQQARSFLKIATSRLFLASIFIVIPFEPPIQADQIGARGTRTRSSDSDWSNSYKSVYFRKSFFEPRQRHRARFFVMQLVF
jgi:hypothetical protein